MPGSFEAMSVPVLKGDWIAEPIGKFFALAILNSPEFNLDIDGWEWYYWF